MNTSERKYRFEPKYKVGHRLISKPNEFTGEDADVQGMVIGIRSISEIIRNAVTKEVLSERIQGFYYLVQWEGIETICEYREMDIDFGWLFIIGRFSYPDVGRTRYSEPLSSCMLESDDQP